MRHFTHPNPFAGQKRQLCELPGFTLTETTYAPGLRMPRHGHDAAYMTLVLQGGYAESVSGTTRNCAPAALVFHPPGEEHAVTFWRDPVRIFRLEAKPQWLARVREHSTLFDAPVIFEKGNLAQLALRLYREARTQDAAAALAIEGAALDLLAAATRQTERTITQPPLWLQRARDLLHAHWADAPELSEVARAAGVHPVSLARAFRRYFHCSIGEYLRRLRIEHACQQLARSDATLVEIAHATGFYDQSHFTRTFKSHLGLTPAEYRATRSAG